MKIQFLSIDKHQDGFFGLNFGMLPVGQFSMDFKKISDLGYLGWWSDLFKGTNLEWRFITIADHDRKLDGLSYYIIIRVKMLTHTSA